MNIFVIPSWYPSESHPTTGIFVKEQTELLARNFQNLNFGISIWGQNDDQLLLPMFTPLDNFFKLLRRHNIGSKEQTIRNNLTEFFHPAITWTWKFLHGNIKGIIKSNVDNLNAFEEKFGPADIIHAHTGFPAGYVAMHVSKAFNIPFIITEHMSPFPFRIFPSNKGKLSNRIQLPYMKSRRNICVSQNMQEAFSQFGLPNLKVINNFVDEEFYDFQSITNKNTEFAFFMLGRLVPQKGVDILLKGFHSVLKRYPETVLKIAGEGHERDRYQKLANGLNISHKIKWLGDLSRTDIKDQFGNCHAFALASRHEGLPVSIIEAIACGRPVIGTVCGGPEEIINETNGYLVPPEDPDALAQAMIRMIENYHDFDQAAIRADFENRFSSRVITRQIVDLYEEVIDEHRKTATNQKM